jgi:hypothetical protein
MSHYKKYNDLIKNRFNELGQNIDQNRMALELFREKSEKNAQRLFTQDNSTKGYNAFSHIVDNKKITDTETVKARAAINLFAIGMLSNYYRHEAETALNSSPSDKYEPIHFDEIEAKSSLVQCQTPKAA